MRSGRRWRLSTTAAIAGILVAVLGIIDTGAKAPEEWSAEWPRTTFAKASVHLEDIISGGPPKDGIPAIDAPSFRSISETQDVTGREPVISLSIGSEARAYPLRILIWHEIVNDEVGGVPVLVTWCPLCNSAVVFERRLEDKTLSFGTTGKLRHSDLVMYDRQTESWWQQFLGEAIVGELTGKQLRLIPSRVESFERFAERLPHGRVLAPPASSAPWGRRRYGTNPYVGYDRSERPFLYRGSYSGSVPPLARVVVVDHKAWTLELLMRRRRIAANDLVLTWEPGQASPLDQAVIEAGADIGNVVVQRITTSGLKDAVYDVSFAFAFRAFYPDGEIVSE
jgi:hypothetical protein